MTYRGHERWWWNRGEKRHTETKGKQTELMWLPVPICKVFNSPENFHATPTFTINSPLYPVYPQTHSSCCTLSPLKLPCMLNLFMSIARGPSQATRTWRMGQERGVWEEVGWGGLIYIQYHTDTDAAPQAKLKLKRNPHKNQSRGLAEGGKRHSPLILANVGHRWNVRIFASKCRNEKIKHTHTHPPAWVWVGCVGVGHGGEIITPPGTGSSLIKLALVFNQLRLQK